MSADAGSATEEVRVRRDQGIAWITLNRPERLNALVGSMRDELADAIRTSAADPEVRVVVITGEGRGFCAGADVDVMSELLDRDDTQTFASLVEAGARVVRQIHGAAKPVIAGVNGVAAGAGASLAAACDLRVASDTAPIGFTFNRIGLHPDWGATHFLPRLVGSARARELIFSGRMVPADEASRIGLFEQVVPAADFQERLRAVAAELAAKPPLALQLAKRSLQDAAGADALEAALKREAEAQLRCFQSRDVREGIAAFREKRRASFAGR